MKTTIVKFINKEEPGAVFSSEYVGKFEGIYKICAGTSNDRFVSFGFNRVFILSPDRHSFEIVDMVKYRDCNFIKIKNEKYEITIGEN